MTPSAKASARLTREMPRRQTIGTTLGAAAASLAFWQFVDRPRTKADATRDGSITYEKALASVMTHAPDDAWHPLDNAHGAALAAVEEEAFLVGYYVGMAAVRQRGGQ